MLMKKRVVQKALLIAGGVLIAFGQLQCSKDSPEPPEETVRIDRSENLLASGESALDFLTNTTFDRIRVQVAYAESAQPTDGALASLEAFLLQRTQKQQVDFELLSLPATGENELSLQQIAESENENRTAYNEGSTLGLYIYFSDAFAEGASEDQNSVTLGAVYRNTSMVIYQPGIRALSNRTVLISQADLESATLMHEMGHLFGLVNLDPGLEADFPHGQEDPQAGNHCAEDGCLMQASLEFAASARKVMESRVARGAGAVPELGPECLRVLASMGGR